MQRLLFLLCFFCISSIALAQWTQVGPEGGFVFDLEKVDGDIWMATGGGLYTSEDDGQTWEISSMIPQGGQVFEISVFDGEVFVVSVRCNINQNGVTRGAMELYRRARGAQSFEKFTIYSRRSYCLYEEHGYEFDLVKFKGRLLVNLFGEILQSLDNGETWIVVEDNERRREYLFASEDNFVMCSAGRGPTSRVLGFDGLSFDIGSINSQGGTGGNIVFMESDTLFKDNIGFYYSVDYGLTWVGIQEVSGGVEYCGPPMVALDEGRRIFIDREGDAVVLSGANVVDRVEDIEDIGHLYSAVFTSSGDYLLGTQFGIFRIGRDDHKITSLNEGFFTREVQNLAISNRGELLTIVKGALLSSADEGIVWDTLLVNDELNERFKLVWMDSTQQSYRLIYSDRYFETVDGGQSFDIETFLVPGVTWPALSINNGIIYADHVRGILFSKDGGVTWAELYRMTNVIGFRGHTFYPTDQFQLVSLLDTVLMTRDDGVSWRIISVENFPDATGHSIATTHILAGDSLSGWLVSKDDGDSWSVVDWPSGLPDVQYTAESRIENIFQIGTEYYVHVYMDGVYVSDQLEGPYSPLKSGLENSNTIFSTYTDEPLVYVGTLNGSLWKRGASFNQVQGVVFEDVDSDLVFGVDDELVSNAIVSTRPGDVAVVTRGDGSYSIFNLPLGDTMRAVAPYPYADISPEYYLVGASASGYDFAVTYVEDVNDLAVHAVTEVHRPGFDSRVTLVISNEGTSDIPADLYIVIPSGVTLTPVGGVSTLRGDTLFTALSTIPSHATMNMDFEVLVDRTVSLGTELCYDVGVLVGGFNAGSDVNPSDNFALACEVVVGAFDPNDKQVIPNTLDPSELEDPRRLSYTIRFQNKGTYYAENVEIQDYLSEDLDLSTFRIDAVSHKPYSFFINHEKKLSVRFDGILLPDFMDNEPESHGFVRFSVKPKPNLELDDRIDNTALIYFDFNEAIVTNTVTTKVGSTTGKGRDVTFEPLLLYPNPTGNVVYLELPRKLTVIAKLDLLDSSGKQLETFKTSFINGVSKESLSQFPVGFYQLVVEYEGVRYVGKLTVSR